MHVYIYIEICILYLFVHWLIYAFEKIKIFCIFLFYKNSFMQSISINIKLNQIQNKTSFKNMKLCMGVYKFDCDT